MTTVKLGRYRPERLQHLEGGSAFADPKASRRRPPKNLERRGEAV